jgi:hypothetical protein
VPDLLATDLEWSPDGSLLAIASGVDQQISGEALQDRSDPHDQPMIEARGRIEVIAGPMFAGKGRGAAAPRPPRQDSTGLLDQDRR